MWTNISKPAALGTELVTNGSFTGNANGWSLGANWAYGSNNVVHTSGSNAILQQIGLVLPVDEDESPFSFRCSFDVIVTTGQLDTVWLRDVIGNSLVLFSSVNVTGTYTVDSSYTLGEFGDALSKIVFGPASNFVGAITNVSVKEILGLWTNISKPSGLDYTNIDKPTLGFTIAKGMATGLLISPTYATAHTNGIQWTKINKPI